MKTKKMFGMLTAKFAAMALICGLAGGAWGATEAITLQYTNMTLNVGTSYTALIAKTSPYNANKNYRIPSSEIESVSISGNTGAITAEKSISGTGSNARVAITVTANAATEGFETITISYDGASAQLWVKVNAPSSDAEAYVVQALSASNQMVTDWSIKQGSEDTLANLLASSESAVEVNNYTGDITIPDGKTVTLSSTSRAQIGTITNNGTLTLGTITAQTIVNNSSLDGKYDYNNPPTITANITNNAQGKIGESSISPFILEGDIVNHGTLKLPTYGKETTISGIIYQYNTDTTLEITGLTTDNISSKVGGVVLADGASVKAVGKYFFKYNATSEDIAAINLAAKEAIGISAASPNYYVVATDFSNSSTSTSYAIFTAQQDPNAPAYVANVAGLGGFETFKAAWDAMMAVSSGNSITLLDDVTVDDVLVDTLTGGSWFLHLNGHTLTVNANGGFSFANDWWIDSSSTAGTIVINGDNLAERFSIGSGEHAKLTIVKGKVNAELGSETSLLAVLNLVYASGYTISDDSTNIYVEKASVVPVAQIGETKYESLADAASHAQSGDTIVLLADTTVPSQINLAVPVTVDFNGKTVTSAADNRVFKIATAVGQYAFKNGTVNTTSPCYGLFRVDNSSTVTVEGIATTNDRSGGMNFRIAGAANVLVTNCTITAANGGGIYAEDEAIVNVYDTTISQTGVVDYNSSTVAVGYGAQTTIHSGTYAGVWGAFVFSSGGTITILDGSVTGSRYALELDGRVGGREDNSVAGSKIIVNGGEINGTIHQEIQVYTPTAPTQYEFENELSITGGKYKNFAKDGYDGTGINFSITGGVFDNDPSTYVASGYAVAALTEGNDYAAGYRYVVGKISTGDLTPVSESETSATYAVPVTVTDDEGNTIATLNNALTVSVSIGSGDIAGTTLSSLDVAAVVADAVASAGSDASSIAVEIQVVASATSSGEGSITYEVHPEAVVTVTKNETSTTSTIALSNDVLAANASFTFDLDVSALGVAVGDWVKVTHVSSGYANEESLHKAKAGGSGVVATVTATHFSTFTATRGDPEGPDAGLLPSVTNKVVSANLFGALTVNAGSSTNAFVAVPFGAFDIGDVKIAAADIVQAAALSAGDRMYVWNGAEGTSQKYEVYKVGANGTWTVEEHKVTVAADGTMTEGSESPELLKVPTGTGIFIERQDTSKPLYVYGQVLTNATATTTFGAGLTLVSAPSTRAMASVNLNALTWNGVGPVTITTTTSGRKIVRSYANADFIYYRNAANKIVRLYYDGSKWGTVSGTWKDAGDEAIIPAGTAFWYMNNGSASVTW